MRHVFLAEEEEGAPPPTKAGGLDYSGRQVRFKVTLTVAYQASSNTPLNKPNLRYTFWGNRRETTPDLPILAPSASTSTAGSTGLDAGSKGGGGKAGAGGGGGGKSGAPTGGGGEVVWREAALDATSTEGSRSCWQWEKTYEPMTADRELALSINANPFLLFTLADKAEGQGIATAVAPKGAPAPAIPATLPPKGRASAIASSAAATAGPVGRNFLYQVVVDTSPLLAVSSSGLVSTVLDATLPSPCAPNPPLPAGLTYLRVDISTLDRQPLLTSGLLHDLNPMIINIRDGRGLPGLRFDTIPEQKFLQPDRHHLLNQHCHPVYASFLPYEDTRMFPRPAQTMGRVNQDHITWDSRTVYLTGHLDRLQLQEKLENEMLHIRVHDRDPIDKSKDSVSEKVRRWEMAVAGGYPVDSTTGEFIEEVDLPTVDPSHVQNQPAMNVFDVDAKILSDWQSHPLKACDKFSHGTASLSLAGLMDQSRQLSSAFFNRNQDPDPTKAPACDERPRIKARFDIVSQRSRRKPKGGAEMEEWNLTVEERLVRHEVGHYVDTGCTLGVQVELHRPLRTLQEGDAEGTGASTQPLRPFGRAAIMFEYNNSQLLRDVMTAIDGVNKVALPSIVGSLRSYELTAEERTAADEGQMDVVCGFQLLDDDCRMVVVEGLGDKGLPLVMNNLKRLRRNDGGYRVLYHPKVRFSHRLYTSFNVDLKKIRLRYPLPLLTQMPEIYDRAKIPMEFFEALQKLLTLRTVNRLSEAQLYGLFPDQTTLEQIESRYGETISKQDIWGMGGKEGSLLSPTTSKADTTGTVSVGGSTSLPSQGVEDGGKRRPGKMDRKSDRRKASTHCWNPEYTEQLHHRTTSNFLAQRRIELIEALRNYYEQKRKREEEDAKDPVPATYQYGGQKLQYVELKKAAMRAALSRRHDAVFTYSHDFMGANFPMIDEFRIQQDTKAKNKSLWKTKEGFVWPVPRRPEELNAHPQKPSQSRIDILKEPWIENENHPKALSRDAGLAPGQSDFHAIACYSRLFGGYLKPEYEREYDSSKVGDPRRLPRGRMKLKSNPDFYSSVHLAGVENIKLQQETLKKEKDEWLSKVVVDSLEFKPTSMVVKDRPSQLDRTTDILMGAPKKMAFRKVRNAHLPSGKPIKWETPPVNMFASEPYTDMRDFTLTFRADEPGQSSKAKKFVLRLHGDGMKPKSQTLIYRRKHTDIPLEEKVGPKWDR